MSYGDNIKSGVDFLLIALIIAIVVIAALLIFH